jgi:RNA polymerase sigma-70 factor (ECF subfamily)
VITRTEVSERDAVSFQIVRPRLFGIAYRVLGSASEADDVVQDAWICWQRTDRAEIRDPAAFLAAMTARLAHTVGQSARARRAMDPEVEALALGEAPLQLAAQGEALELALLALLERVSPSERAADVLREAFDYRHRRIRERRRRLRARA